VPSEAVGESTGNAGCILQCPSADFIFFIFESNAAPQRHILDPYWITRVEDKSIVRFARGNVENAPAVESKRLRDFGMLRIELLCNDGPSALARSFRSVLSTPEQAFSARTGRVAVESISKIAGRTRSLFIFVKLTPSLISESGPF
jgi:hypothetical protein